MRTGSALFTQSVLALCLAGCVATAPPVSTPDSVSCRQLYNELDAVTDRCGVRDQGSAPVSGFPYLRSNRFLASFAKQLKDAQFETWVRQLAVLDTESRAFERNNLPATEHAALTDPEALQRCSTQLLAEDLAHADRRQTLRRAAQVPDDYLPAWRAAGLYPVSALFVKRGIASWHREAHATFAMPLQSLPVHGQLQRWSARSAAVLTAGEVRQLINASRDTLDIPQPRGATLQRLFDSFAPSWEVDVVSDDDRIGAAGLVDGVRVDTGSPVEYRLVSQTRYAGRVLLQLNYVVWFPARSGNDRYAGRLDGLTWRVTLGPDGVPIMYDTIHNCGCFLQFFPAPQLRLRTDAAGIYRETPLVPQHTPAQPLVIRLSHATHFIERVYIDDAAQPVQAIASRDYNDLRSLADGSGHHSLFGVHGIVAGSERGERFLLWPMGIRSPGAMRQWGHHPVAFVGRRHFDDPDLIGQLFETVETNARY